MWQVINADINFCASNKIHRHLRQAFLQGTGIHVVFLKHCTNTPPNCPEAASAVVLEQSPCVQVTSQINNLIMGKIYIEHTGIMRINNLQSSLVAKNKFKESGRLSSKDQHQVIAASDCMSKLLCPLPPARVCLCHSVQGHLRFALWDSCQHHMV